MQAYRPDERFDELCRTAFFFEETGDTEGAIECYLVAARLGEPIAQSNLALILETKVNPPRRREAIYWNMRAVRSGFPMAAWNLAINYRNRGKDRWYLHWMGVAAKLGYEDARHQILNPVSGPLEFHWVALVDEDGAALRHLRRATTLAQGAPRFHRSLFAQG
jgi:TPR repeat protein